MILIHIIILGMIELILRYFWLIRLYVIHLLSYDCVLCKCDGFLYYNVDNTICTR